MAPKMFSPITVSSMLALARTKLILRTVPTRAFSASADKIKQLRQVTGAPMHECRAALLAADVAGDLDKAVDWLRKKGVATASKKSGRAAAEGLVAAAVNDKGSSVVTVEVGPMRER